MEVTALGGGTRGRDVTRCQVIELRPEGRAVRVVCVSDTHGRHAELEVPPGDIFVHAGDFSHHGTPEELAAFDAWLGALPHRHKVVVAGNHEVRLARLGAERTRRLFRHAIYLEDRSVTLLGVKIYGAPHVPYRRGRGFELDDLGRARAWQNIPSDTDVLVTHTPPFGILDRVKTGERVGCEALTQRVRRVAPALHVFGHIHEAAGVEGHGATVFANAASLTPGGGRLRDPLVFDVRAALKPHQLRAINGP